MSTSGVRSYRKTDRAAVRKIAVATAMMGVPSATFFDDDEVMADVLTFYYTNIDAGSSYVIEQQGQVVGYIVAVKDTRRMDRFSYVVMWPLIFFKALLRGVFFRSGNMKLFRQVWQAYQDGRLRLPDFSRDYPATLHINLLPEERSRGAGKALMEACCSHLKIAGVRGVRMSTMSKDAGVFFEKCGFTLLFSSSRPYFRHLTGADVPCLVYGRKFVA